MQSNLTIKKDFNLIEKQNEKKKENQFVEEL